MDTEYIICVVLKYFANIYLGEPHLFLLHIVYAFCSLANRQVNQGDDDDIHPGICKHD